MNCILQTKKWTWKPDTFCFKTFLWYTSMCLQKIFLSQHPNKQQELHRKIQSETRAMWVVGTVRVSHCDHNSFSGTAECMGVIHTKSSKACCSVFFSAVTWSGLWEMYSHLTGNFTVLFRAALYSDKSNVSVRKYGLRVWMFTAGSRSIADNNSFVSHAFPTRLKSCKM